MNPLALLLAPFIGLLLALFGAGGGMTTVPLLHYGLHLPLKEAIASSLWIVTAVSLATLLRQRAWAWLNFPLLARFAGGGMAGAWIGVHIGLVMPAAWQSAIFGALTCFVALWMHRAAPRAEAGAGLESRPLRTLAASLALGVITGVLGVGGGFLMVPALLALGLPDYKKAVMHSLLLITINAGIAGLGYLGKVHVEPLPLLTVAVLAMAGSLVGQRLLQRWSGKRLQRGFSLLLLLIGGVMLAEAARDFARLS